MFDSTTTLALLLSIVYLAGPTSAPDRRPGTATETEKVDVAAATAPQARPFDFDRHVGVALAKGDGPCLLIPHHDLHPGDTVTLVPVESGPRRLTALVTAREAACEDGVDRTGFALEQVEPAGYRLGADLAAGILVLALVGSFDDAAETTPGFQADLDGDGTLEHVRSCAGGEGLHLSLWSGAPPHGERRWEHYLYLGYAIEPDCDEREVGAPDPFDVFMAWWREGARVTMTGSGPWEDWESPPDVLVARLSAKLEGGRTDSLEAGDAPVNLPRARSPVEAPPDYPVDAFETYVLSDQDGVTLYLLVPTDRGGADREPSDACDENRTLLLAAGSDAGAELQANPHCWWWVEMGGAGLEDLDFHLYWLRGESYPLVELVTDGPACIPVYLYRFDADDRRYRLVAGGPTCGDIP